MIHFLHKHWEVRVPFYDIEGVLFPYDIFLCLVVVMIINNMQQWALCRRADDQGVAL